MTVTASSAAAPGRAPQSRDALRSATVYAAGTALQRGLPFVLLPLYTRAISPADYGALSILLAVSTAAGFLFAFGLDLAIFRTYFELVADQRRQQLFIDSIWRFLVLVPPIAALTIGALAWPFLEDLPIVHGLDGVLALLAAALWVASSTVPLTLVRAQQRLRAFLILTGVSAVSTTLLTLLLVVVVHGNVTGWLLAATLANACSLLAALVVVPWHRRGSMDWTVVHRSLRFGGSVLPHTLSFWALSLADRIILAGLVSSTALGIYSLGINLGLPVMIAVQSLNQGFMPAYARAGTDPAHRSSLDQVVLLQITAVVSICLTGVLLGPPLVNVIASASYAGAGLVVAWSALGFGFLGLYYIPMNGATLGAGRTRLVWVATLTSAIVNVGLLFVLVPKGGIILAAVASAIGYFVLLAGIAIYAHGRGNPVRYRWLKIVPVVLVAVGLYVGASVSTPSTGLLGVELRVAWIALYPILLVVFKIVDLRRVTSIIRTGG